MEAPIENKHPDVFRIGPGRVEHREGNTIVSAIANDGQTDHELTVTFHDEELTISSPAMGDALMTISLFAAMATGQTLEVADPVSPQLLKNLDRIQGAMHLWYPYLSIVEVQANPIAEEATAQPSSGPGKGAHFFSGGIDSLHSIMTCRTPIDTLVFVDGSDVRMSSTPEFRRMSFERLKDAATHWKRPLVHIDSNIREWTMACGHHADDFVGSRLAFIAHLMGEKFDGWVIAPSVSGNCNPFPSHPVLDPLWSSERVRIHHPLPERSRAEKTWDLAQEDGLQHLRICMLGQDYNCGTCRKCIRTLLTLQVLGVADRAPVFAENPSIPKILEQLRETKQVKTERQYLRETIDLATEAGVDPDLIDQLEETWRVLEARLTWDQVVKIGNEFSARPRWEQLPFEARRTCFRSLLTGNPEWITKELAAALPEQQEVVFARLWKSDRRWLKSRLRKASLGHLARKLGLRR